MSKSPNRLLGLILGLVYLVVGAVGFTVSGSHAFVGEHGGDLLGFQVNGLHNVVHLAVGLLLLVGAVAGAMAAKSLNIIVGVVYLAVGVLGFFVPGPLNVLALNMPDHYLHLASAILLVVVGISADRKVTAAV
jgi:hypothetical protein